MDTKHVALFALIVGLSTGCRQRSAQRVVGPQPTYTSATYVQAQGPGIAPVQAQPPYQDVRIVQQHPQTIPNVPNSVGQESLSTGERVTVVTYVHHYAEPVDTFPSIYWSGRWFYNIHGNFVFWDPFWSRWAYYWGPPNPLVVAWNIQYPWVAFSWGRGFYGPGWYWGGVNPSGFHQLGQVAPSGVTPAPLPSRPQQSMASAVPRPSFVPNPNSTPRPNQAVRPNPTSRPRPNAVVRPNPNSHPRPNRAVTMVPSPQRIQGLSRNSTNARPNGPGLHHLPRPSQVVHEMRRRPTYIQGSRVHVTRPHHVSHGTSQVRVYRAQRPTTRPGWRPNHARPNYSSTPRPNYSSTPRPNYSSTPRPNYSSTPRPNYSSTPRRNHSSSPRANHATSQQRTVGVSRSRPR